MPEAAPRDASWYRAPDVYRLKSVHIDDGEGFAACNSRTLLASEAIRWRDAADVPTDVRCRRSACARLFDLQPGDSEP